MTWWKRILSKLPIWNILSAQILLHQPSASKTHLTLCLLFIPCFSQLLVPVSFVSCSPLELEVLASTWPQQTQSSSLTPTGTLTTTFRYQRLAAIKCFSLCREPNGFFPSLTRRSVEPIGSARPTRWWSTALWHAPAWRSASRKWLRERWCWPTWWCGQAWDPKLAPWPNRNWTTSSSLAQKNSSKMREKVSFFSFYKWDKDLHKLEGLPTNPCEWSYFVKHSHFVWSHCGTFGHAWSHFILTLQLVKKKIWIFPKFAWKNAKKQLCSVWRGSWQGWRTVQRIKSKMRAASSTTTAPPSRGC